MMWGFGVSPSVPWVPTRDEVVETVVRLLNPLHGDVVYDLGCGDGRIAVSIARRYPWARVRCIEIRGDLVEKARDAARTANVPVDVIHGDFFKLGLSDANIIYMYLLTSVNQKLKPKLETELRPGTLLVSLDFPVPEWIEVARVELPRSWQRTLYVYVVGYSDAPARGLQPSLEALREGLRRLKLEALPPGERSRVKKLLEA